MKKLTFLLVLSAFVLGIQPACALTNEEADEAAYEQARRDYRVFLDELKALSKQYKEITGEIKEVLKEEGVPAVDQETGEITSRPYNERPSRASFGDADIKETDNKMIVKIDLPGVKKDDIKVSIEEGKFLKIEGERDQEKEDFKKTDRYQYYRAERQHGYFRRNIKLPSRALEDETDARYENGVLTVTIKKAPEAEKEVTIPVR